MKPLSRLLVLILLVTFVPQVCNGLLGEDCHKNTVHEQLTPVKDPAGHLQLLYEAFSEVEEEDSGRESFRDLDQPQERFQMCLVFRERSAFRHTMQAAEFRVPRTSIFVRVHSFLI